MYTYTQHKKQETEGHGCVIMWYNVFPRLGKFRLSCLKQYSKDKYDNNDLCRQSLFTPAHFASYKDYVAQLESYKLCKDVDMQ